MLFKILIIDDEYRSDNFAFIPKNLSNTHISILSDYSTLYAVLKEKDFHLIIINPDIFAVDEFKTLLDENRPTYNDTPIFILSEDEIDNEFSFVHDQITLKMPQSAILNKIKFCKRMLEREISHQANINRLLYIDNLTQLPNRTRLIKDLQEKSINISALALIDIKHFRGINDFFGIRVGDRVIKHVGNLIKDYIKLIMDKASLYKFPSDVFCLANNGLSEKEFKEMIFYIISGIKSEIIREQEHEVHIDAVAGITYSTKKNKLITADLALQQAKIEKKHYLVFYEELDNLQEYEKNMFWTKKLKLALDNDDITIYYQPILDNQSKEINKYEVLVRLYDPVNDEIISPHAFLEISKKAGLYKDITKRVIEKSFQTFEKLDHEFSINISYEDISDATFLIYIEEKLKAYNVANRVVWEILEDENIKDYAILINFIKSVKALGCKVAIDDFGSGYSNFEHLLKMDVDYLKIDASLVKNIVHDQTSYKIVESILNFAKNLGIKTIAEYVETEEIYEVLKQLNTNFSQGYYISKPIEKPNFKNKEDLWI